MSALLQIRRRIGALLAIVGLVVVATVVGLYILNEQRLRFPWDDIYTVRAEFSTGQALTPGQGQAITVAGVKVGEIAKVTLRDGRAVVDMAIERERLRQVNADATMLMRPRTGLQDMTIDVDPGSPRAGRLGADDVLGVARTTPSVNLDEVLASLDRDTRAYATALVGGLGGAVKDRGEALRAAFRASAPTLRTQRRVAAATADRRRELARAISSLNRLTRAVGRDDESVGRLVRAGNATFTAVAAEDDALRAGLERLPDTLDAARTTLRATTPFARATGPALDALVPATRALPRTLERIDPLLTDGLPALRNLDGLSEEARPLARDLGAASTDLSAVTPELTTAFEVLRFATNMLAYNPPGEDEGYLYRLAWYLHNQNSFLSGQDGNGPFWRGQVIVSCSTGLNNPTLVGLLGPVVDQLDICPKTAGDT